MSKEALALKVNKKHGEKAIALTRKLGVDNKKLRILKEEQFIFVPIRRSLREEELKRIEQQLEDFELSYNSFLEKKNQPQTLDQLLEKKLPAELIKILPRSIDIVGDIAIIEVPRELAPQKKIVGEGILKIHRNIRTVLAKAGVVNGTFRLRKIEIIAGEHRTETIHAEHGCKYHVDVAKTYFSPRLSYEHKRVATLVQKGEIIVDLFAGVGPFSVLIARKNKEVKVYALDINQIAFEYLKDNVRLNRVENLVFPKLGDARKVVGEDLSGIANRVIMNLPEKAIEFVDVACRALKPEGGIIHFYSFLRSPDSMANLKQRFTESVEESGRELSRFLSTKNVRATAPYQWQVVLDAKIS